MKCLQFLNGFRKFSVIVGFMIVMVAMRLTNYTNGAEFAENLQLAVVAYMGANISEHIIDVTKQWLNSKKESVEPLVKND